MKKSNYLFKRVMMMNYKGFFKTIKEIHQKTNKKSLVIFFDIVSCGLKYQAGYRDYNLFEMYNMNNFERKTIITRGINNEFIKKYNSKKYEKYFQNKAEFNKMFNKYLNYDWLEIKKNNKKEFKEFCQNHPQIIAKPSNKYMDKEIMLIDTTQENINDLYNRLLKNNLTIIEEQITECNKLQVLHQESLNTIRVVTLLGDVVVAFLKIGTNHNSVDSFNHDGLIAPIEIDTGVIKYPAVDRNNNLYEKHPLTNKPIVDLKIPKWKEIKEICEITALEIPQVGYIGWDIAVGKDKCYLLGANCYPRYDIYQLPAHRENNVGLLPKFTQVEERKIDK